MMILPSDGSTFQINFKEALGRAIGDALNEDADLTVVAQQALDDYALAETFDVLKEDHGDARVISLKDVHMLKGRSVFVALDVAEYIDVQSNWATLATGKTPPCLWRVPFTNEPPPPTPAGALLVTPCSTQDAYSLTRGILRQATAAVILEHQRMYDVEGYVNLDLIGDPGKALVRRSGTDISLFATSWLVIEALQAAEVLASAGIDAEVVDFRSITNTDLDTLRTSAAKTGKAIVLDHLPMLSLLRDSKLAQAGWPFSSALPQDEAVGTVRIVRLVEELLNKPSMALDQVQFYGYGRTFCGPF